MVGARHAASRDRVLAALVAQEQAQLPALLPDKLPYLTTRLMQALVAIVMGGC